MSPASNAAPTSTYQTIRCLDSLAPGAELASSSSDSSQQHFLLLKLPRQQLQDLPQLQQLVQQSVALRHPNVLQVHELFLTSQHLVVVQEGCSDCSLAQFLQQRRQQGRQLSEAAARCWFQQVVLAVDYCHRQGLTGLPIQHILLQDNPGRPPLPKLPCPLFALAHSSSSSSSSSSCQNSTALQGTLHDMQACGALLLHLLGGQMTAAAPEAAATGSSSSSSSQALIQLPKGRSAECQELVQQLLLQSPGLMLCSTHGIMSSSWFEQGLLPDFAALNQQVNGNTVQLCKQTREQLDSIVAAVHDWPPQFAVYQRFADLAAALSGLQVQQQQVYTGLGSSWVQVYETECTQEQLMQQQLQQQQSVLPAAGALWVYCLPAFLKKSSDDSSSSGQTLAAAEQLASLIGAVQWTQHLILRLSCKLEGFSCKPPAPELLSAMRQLATAAAGGACRKLVPVIGLCLQPPLLLQEAPPLLQLQQGPAHCTLSAWLQEQPRFNSGWMGYDRMYAADIRSSSSSSSSSSKMELWAAGAPWAYMLQLLCDVAAALVDLHSLQPPLTHGAANAGAVHLLSAPPCATHARQLQNASTADSLIPQQQQQQVAQLSWVGPWRHAVSSSRQLSHPLLTAPEVLMHGAPFSAATDVYGFGMIMLQLAACWAPAEHELGSTDRFRDIDSSLRVLQQHGTLLAAVESQQVFDGWRQQLPAGYWQLARSCCSGNAADRPSAEEALRRCSALAEALRPA
uniref:Protein kinase domain-containing protein n=1 Tax=Tetradesmus obliquus TaxID=3088 RepID=A0A383WDA6_TETOB|eukprot:jgi/Sobl393_1/457/SZX59770.1